MSGTVNAKTVRATLGAARALGLDAGALANTWGLSEALTDVDARFPHAAWLALWQDIIARTGSESIGIDAAERLPWGHFDVLDCLVGTAEDFGAALRRMERYFALVATGVTHVLEDHGETVHLVRRYAPECYTRRVSVVERVPALAWGLSPHATRQTEIVELSASCSEIAKDANPLGDAAL